MAPSSTRTTSSKRRNKKLSTLIQKRDKKREKVQSLFDKIQTLQKEMNTIEQELFQMDDEIWELEKENEDENDENDNTNDTINDDTAVPLTEEFLTDPMTQLRQDDDDNDPNDTLTDPYTQRPPQQQQAEELSAFQTPTAEASNTTNLQNYQQQQQQLQQQYPEYDDSFSPQQQQQQQQQDEMPIDHRPSSNSSSVNAVAPPFVTPATADIKPTIQNKNAFQELVSPNCPYSTEEIQHVLQHTFRIPSFRETQLSVIQATLAGQDVFVIMRTGGGKSLTYQLPVALEMASPHKKVTLVISPLLSLIQDQEEQMNDIVPGSCVSFTSSVNKSIQAQNWQRVRDAQHGGVGMILVTPERVYKSNKLKSELQLLYEQGRLGRFVIDECHCACQWGHDFRPDYAKLGVLKHHFPNVPCLAVTATASERVREDCSNILNLSRHYRFFRSTANRPNLHYEVRWKDDGIKVVQDMVHFIQEHHPRDAGIIYTYSKKDANTVANQLCDCGIVAEAYHSDVSATKKSHVHQSWMRNETQVVVATIAFGLGINKPDVRFVLHHSLSKTLEAYYQESGRAGRDGHPADCILYYSPKDVPRMIKMIHGEVASEHLFQSMVRYAIAFGNDSVCRKMLLQSLGETDPNFLQLLQQQQEQQEVEERDVTSHAVTLLQLLFEKESENVTMAMIVKEWRTKPDNALECVKNNPPGKELSVSDCEHMIVALHLEDMIGINVKYTAYDSVVYWKCTAKAETFLISDKARITIRMPKNKRKSSSAVAALPITSTTANKNGGWVTTKKTTTTAKRTKATKAASKKKASKKASKKTTSAKKKKSKVKIPKPKTATSKKPKSATNASARTFFARTTTAQPEVIELDDDDDDDLLSDESSEDEALSNLLVRIKKKKKVEKTKTKTKGIINDDDSLWDDDSENEFMG